MIRRRKTLFVVCLILVPGSISVTLAYSLHLRSAAYRRAIADGLSQRLGMHVEIERVRPLSSRSRELQDVRVFLDQDGPQVFACERAVYKDVPSQSTAPFTLELINGWLLAGSSTWTSDEYRRMLAGGLGHDFAALGLGIVRLKDIDLLFTNPLFEFKAGGTSGLVLFDQLGKGQAALSCHRLGGRDVDTPIDITARFTPGEQVVLHQFRLTVPRISIASLGLDELLGDLVTRGEFEGTIDYEHVADRDIITVFGSIAQADLRELSAKLPGGPFDGIVDIDLDRARFNGRHPQILELHGKLSGLRIPQIAPRLAGDPPTGTVDLNLDQLRWVDGRITYLSGSGCAADLSLDVLSGLFGQGRITGTLRADIRSLLVEEDELSYADIELTAQPPSDRPGLIDRELLSQAAQKWLGLDPSAALPEHVEYRTLGVRFVVDGQKLEVLGTHGTDSRTILTVSILGRDFAMIQQPDRSFALPDVMNLLRTSAEEVSTEQVRSWWEWLQTEDTIR